MSNSKKWIAFCLKISFVFIFMTGCEHQPAAGAVPAILIQPNKADHPAIEKALGKLLNQKQVVFSGEVFSISSIASFERSVFTDTQGNTIQGRELGLPIKIQLQVDNNTCYLKNMQTNEFAKIKNISCRPE